MSGRALTLEQAAAAYAARARASRDAQLAVHRAQRALDLAKRALRAAEGDCEEANRDVIDAVRRASGMKLYSVLLDCRGCGAPICAEHDRSTFAQAITENPKLEYCTRCSEAP